MEDEQMTDTVREAHAVISSHPGVTVTGTLSHEDGFVYDGPRPWSVSLEQLRPTDAISVHLFERGGGVGERAFPPDAAPSEIVTHVLQVLHLTAGER